MGQPIWLAQLYFRGNSMPTVSCGEVRLSVTCLLYNSETFSVFVLMNSTCLKLAQWAPLATDSRVDWPFHLPFA